MHEKLDDEWLKWSPEIWIGPGKDPRAKSESESEKKPKRVHHKAKSKKHGFDLNPIHWFEDLL